MENSSLPVENRVMHTDGDNDSEETLSIPQATTTKASKINEDGFRKYLIAQGKRNWKQILLKATKHGHILETKDASEILAFSNTKRRHVMEALVCLSKYRGALHHLERNQRKISIKMDITR
jgi:hypothetical protein